MNLETVLAALRTAGYQITPIAPDLWQLQYGQGPHAINQVLTSAALIAVVTQHAAQAHQPNNPALDLPQTVAMLRAAGLAVEPIGPGYWQVVFIDGTRTLADLFTAERLLQLGNTVAETVPWLISGRRLPDAGERSRSPVSPTAIYYTLFRLGRATARAIAWLNLFDEQELGAMLITLAGAGTITAGPEETWALTLSGWQHIAHMVPADIKPPTEQELPDPRLAIVVARLIHDLRPLQLTRLELIYPGIAASLPGAPGRSALLVASPAPHGIAWTRNLATQAAAVGVPTLTFATELIEADRATSTALNKLLALIRSGNSSNPTMMPCLVAADDGLAATVLAEMKQLLPAGPWAVSTVDGAQAGQWTTYSSGRLEVDLTLALYQTRN